MQLTRGFGLKKHYDIKRHDRFNAPDDEQIQEQQRVA